MGLPVRAKTYLSHNRRSNKAKQLVETKQMSREPWLQIRKQEIDSNDAVTAGGLNPHMSMFELWMIKTGRMQQGNVLVASFLATNSQNNNTILPTGRSDIGIKLFQ